MALAQYASVILLVTPAATIGAASLSDTPESVYYWYARFS